MRLEDPAGESPEQEVPLPAVVEQPSEVLPARRPHLVAVVTRPIGEEDAAAPGATIRERFWHPHHHRWMEEDFASLDALRRRHTEEEQWQLIQEQQLDEPLCVELGDVHPAQRAVQPGLAGHDLNSSSRSSSRSGSIAATLRLRAAGGAAARKIKGQTP